MAKRGEIVDVYEQAIVGLEVDELPSEPVEAERTVQMFRRGGGQVPIDLDGLNSRTDSWALLKLMGVARLLTLRLPPNRRTWINLPPSLFGNDDFVRQLVADVEVDGLSLGAEALEVGEKIVADVDGALVNAHLMVAAGIPIGMDDVPLRLHTLQNLLRIIRSGWPVERIKIDAPSVTLDQIVEIAGYGLDANIPTIVVEKVATRQHRDAIQKALEDAGVGICGQVLGQGRLWQWPGLLFRTEELGGQQEVSPLTGPDPDKMAGG